MADYFTDWREVSFEFNGDMISMQMRPLKVGEMAILTPLIAEVTSLVKPKEELTSVDIMKQAASSFKIQAAAESVLKDSVKDIKGFTINGEQPTLEKVCGEAMFITIVGDMIREIFNLSQLKQEDEKNSDGASVTQHDSA